MSKTNDGGPAFPGLVETGKLQIGADELAHPVFGAQGGMSLRDWFAGQALAGMMANETTPFSADHAECEPRLIAEAVYELADAMLAERERHP